MQTILPLSSSDVARFLSAQVLSSTTLSPHVNSPCRLWTGSRFKSGGYGAFSLRNKAVRAHRVAWELAYGRIPEGLIVCHKCDVPACVEPSHLFLGGHKENMLDKEAKGRGVHPRGAASAQAVLTEEDVVGIRAAYASGSTTMVDLAKLHGCDWTTIRSVVNRRTWKHLL